MNLMTSLLQINWLFAKLPMKAFHSLSLTAHEILKINGPYAESEHGLKLAGQRNLNFCRLLIAP